jgi:hypothetical protein
LFVRPKSFDEDFESCISKAVIRAIKDIAHIKYVLFEP